MASSDVTVSRYFDCDTDEVWRRLTDRAGFEQWMGTGSTIAPEVDGELIAADPESDEPKIGRVLRAEPGRLLHWVWRPLGGDEASTEVVIEITPVPEDDGEGTILTVTESPSTIDVASPVGALAMSTC